MHGSKLRRWKLYKFHKKPCERFNELYIFVPTLRGANYGTVPSDTVLGGGRGGRLQYKNARMFVLGV